MPSRDDVARLAGVSGATVSYVLNNTPGIKVRPETRERVLQAAAELRYQPSQAARVLASGRFNQIGVLMPPAGIGSHCYHLGVLDGAWTAAVDQHYRLVIDAWTRERTELSFLAERFVDGLIAPGVGPETFAVEARARFKMLQIPVVVVGSGSWSEEFHTVDVDNLAIGSTAAQHFVDLGHRVCAVFGGLATSCSVERRRSGFAAGLRSAGLDLRAEHVYDVGGPANALDPGVAAQIVRQLNGATAIFCYNDSAALALWRAALDAGLSVPGDLSIIGVDDDPAARLAGVSLSTFAQPLAEMGRRAVELILAAPTEPLHEFFPHRFIPGATLGPPKAG